MTIDSVGNHYLEEKVTNTYKNDKRGECEFSKKFEGSIGNIDETCREKEKKLKANSRIADIRTFYNAAMTSVNGTSDNEIAITVSECGVRDISNKDSDRVKMCMNQGCVYKMQVNEEKETVYMEEKMEDGTVKGYEIYIAEIPEDSSDKLENLALETWKLYHTGNTTIENKGTDHGVSSFENEMHIETTDEKFLETLLKFYEFVEDRVENGSPKIQIGASAISEKDWEKLIKKVDDNIDEIKKELRERIEKQLQQENQQKMQQEKAQQQKVQPQVMSQEDNLIQKILQ